MHAAGIDVLSDAGRGGHLDFLRLRGVDDGRRGQCRGGGRDKSCAWHGTERRPRCLGGGVFRVWIDKSDGHDRLLRRVAAGPVCFPTCRAVVRSALCSTLPLVLTPADQPNKTSAELLSMEVVPPRGVDFPRAKAPRVSSAGRLSYEFRDSSGGG